jgi:hypothetical protein
MQVAPLAGGTEYGDWLRANVRFPPIADISASVRFRPIADIQAERPPSTYCDGYPDGAG